MTLDLDYEGDLAVSHDDVPATIKLVGGQDVTCVLSAPRAVRDIDVELGEMILTECEAVVPLSQIEEAGWAMPKKRDVVQLTCQLCRLDKAKFYIEDITTECNALNLTLQRTGHKTPEAFIP